MLPHRNNQALKQIAAGTYILILFAIIAVPSKTAMAGNHVFSLAPIVKEVSPAVVNIATRGMVEVEQHPFFNDPFFRHFFGKERQGPQQRQNNSIGSGVIIDSDNGYIITNSHVVAKADEIIVTLKDKRQAPAKLIGHDPATDIAILKVESEGLAHLTMADSDSLEVGDFVLAIGNPFGLGQSVSSGIVSALGRTRLGIESYENFIQTDASINPGNSGGALVDLEGKLVGINTAILAPSGGNIGIGFAIPINMARKITDQIIEYGMVRRGRIGVQIQDLTPDLAKNFGVDHDGGALVTQVVPKSPADRAEIVSGDTIIAVNGKTVTSSADLRTAIGLLRVGSEVHLRLIREGIEIGVSLQIGEIEKVEAHAKNELQKLKGASLAAIPQSSPLFGKLQGVFVENILRGSPAWRAGLRQNDIITSINRKPIKNLKNLIDTAEEIEGPILLNIVRDGGSFFVLIR